MSFNSILSLFCVFLKSGHTNLSQMCRIKVPESGTYGKIWAIFVKILTANSSRTFGHRKYLIKHKLKAHYRTSFTQKKVSIYKNEGARASAIHNVDSSPAHLGQICVSPVLMSLFGRLCFPIYNLE